MGYGSRALALLTKYFQGKIFNISETNGDNATNEIDQKLISVDADHVGLLEEQIGPRKNLPPLLSKLNEVKPIRLDWLGVSYGLTNNLLRFWKRSGFIPVYLRQTTNDLTGEHSCIQLKMLHSSESEYIDEKSNWLLAYYKDFRKRFLTLLSYQFRSFNPSLSLSVLQHKSIDDSATDLSRNDLAYHFTNYDLKRLELYGQNLVDHHLITDLLPEVSKLYFLKRINVHLSPVQAAILLSSGLQHKNMDDISKDLDVPSTQLMGLFNKAIRKIVQKFNAICEAEIASKMEPVQRVDVRPSKISLVDDLNEAEAETRDKLANEKQKLTLDDDSLAQFAIRGTEDDWNDALKGAGTGLLSVKRSEKAKRKLADLDFEQDKAPSMKTKQKGKHKKKFKR